MSFKLDDKSQAISETAGIKNDAGKAPMELISPIMIEQVAQVLGFGAKKYSAHNWRLGIARGRILGSLLRHTFDYMRGIDVDAESGLPQTAHIACNAMFLCELHVTHPELDDRYKV